MAAPHIDEILALVGRLDDSTVEDPARNRFRVYLRETVTSPGQLRQYVQQCLETPDEQHTRALKDLLNHYGRLLGFEVAFGPYEWLPGQVGYDGRWISPWGLHVVLEIKTRETYTAQRPSLARSIEQLISDRRIPNWNLALGLYVVASPHVQINHLEKVILDEKQAHQLRIITPESLFVLAELLWNASLTEQDVLTVMRSSSPSADWLVELVSRLAVRTAEAEAELPPGDAVSEPARLEVEQAPEEPTPEPGRVEAEQAPEEPTPEPGRVEAEQAPEEPTPEPGRVEAEQARPEPAGAEAEQAPEEPTPEPARPEAEGVSEEAGPEKTHAAAPPTGAPQPTQPAVNLGRALECFGECLVKALEALIGPASNRS